jgi:hypothetical protein
LPQAVGHEPAQARETEYVALLPSRLVLILALAALAAGAPHHPADMHADEADLRVSP